MEHVRHDSVQSTDHQPRDGGQSKRRIAMLEDCFVESRRSWSQKKPLTVTLSIAIHSWVLGGLILIPLFQIQVLPQVQPIPPLPTLGPRNDMDVLIVHIGRPGYGGSRSSASAAVLISPTVIPSKVEFGGDVPEPEILAI